MQEQGILPMNMDPSLSSSSSLETSMQAMILNTMMDPLLPMLDHDHGLNMYIGGASGYEFNGAPPCMTHQVRVNSSDHGLYGPEGIFGGVNVGIPPLESVSCMEENAKSQTIQDNSTDKHPYSSYVSSLNKNCNSTSTDHNKTDNAAAEMGNFWHGEELKVGEYWDLEDFMRDVSACPSLDFQS
jgi:myb proto-oncogene protein